MELCLELSTLMANPLLANLLNLPLKVVRLPLDALLEKQTKQQKSLELLNY